MNKNDEVMTITPWPFIIADAVLLGTAYLIANQASAPLHGAPLICIAVCVSLGAISLLIPFVLNHTARQDHALAERQRELASIAHTHTTSAEQLSIAVASLHAIADNASKALKHAEALPHKLQEKINDFKIQLNDIAVTDNESLAQEVNTLRTSEIERLESAFASMRKTADELSSLEAASRQHIAKLNASLALFSSSAEKSASESASAFTLARTQAEHSFNTTQAAALASLENKFNTLSEQLLARLQPAATTLPLPSPASLAVTPPPDQPDPAPAQIAPPTPEPLTPIAAAPSPITPDPLPAPEPAAPPPKRPLRRTANALADHPTLGLDLGDDYAQSSPDDTAHASALSSDGNTRLIVTAYIGIGNKLHVRGDGPGLSLTKGTPLQFISIGKWRWDSDEITQPITLRLYKNDEQECVSLGAVTLQPGHQHEVLANFS